MDVFGTATEAVIDTNPEVKGKLGETLAQWKQEFEDVDREVQLDATNLSHRVSVMDQLLHRDRK